ncbi:MAG TPA: VIT domain-containing protein [Gemmataceae bacterium]|jgi:Ca-activated chloride channel family protein
MKQSLPEMLDDEMRRYRPAEEDGEAGFGALTTERGCLPLKALDVQARFDGLIARVTLTQTFVNVHAEALEATYIFPLPDRAAVTRFRLEAAGRVIEGELKERGAARREYDKAIQAGQRAAITEEERPGVFTMRVGNLPPAEEATVRLTLTGPLPYSDGEATFRFPLVVAPRYVPGVPIPGPSVGDGVVPDTDAVPDASRISPPVLLPGFPNPVRLGLSVEVPTSSLKPSDFRSSLHTIIESEDNDTKLFRLQPGERLDRDFIVRFRIAQERTVTSLSLQPDRDGSEGTFLLTLVPPAQEAGHSMGRDVVFVLDRSGSMEGWKMVAARRALARMVDTLTEQDRFTVYAFDDRIETPPEFAGNHLISATNRLRFRAVEFLAKIDSRGGTEMAEPLNRAVNELSGEKNTNRERILVLVTDGQVGNEDQILKHLGQRVKGLRIFTLGIDRAVNAAFLRRLADLGGGRSEVVESEDRLDEVMDMVHRHIGTPVLTELRLEPAGLKFLPDSVVPGRLPALFAGTPLLISGRYRGDADGAIALQARDAARQMWSVEVRGRRVDNPALTAVWARGRLREMEDRYVIGTGGQAALEREIVATSLRFGVLCRFTAFVAVDRSEVVNPGGQVHGVVQPVEQPAGWETQTLCGTAPSALRSLGHAKRKQARGEKPCAPPPESRALPPEISRGSGDSETESVDSMLADFGLSKEFDDEVTRSGAFALEEEARDADADSIELDRALGLSPRSRKRRAKDQGLGLIQRLLSLFRRKKSKAAGAGTIDRSLYRQRGLDLLQALHGSSVVDTSTRLAVLRSLVAKLKELFKDLATAGDFDPSVKALGEAVLRLHTLLAENQPAETDILDVWTQIENALRTWLALGETTESPRREGFWK